MPIRQSFHQSSLVQEALTTKGYAYEHHLDYDNQRLEFLGDSVMDLIISEELFQDHSLSEGELTRLRSSAVNEQSFAKLAKRFELDKELKVATGQVMIDSLLADAFEAFIGAYYLSHGYATTKDFILQNVLPLIDFTPERDPKTLLNEKLQALGIAEHKYRTISQTGPDHASQFLVGLIVAGQEVARGSGRSKKEAQKAAAADYLKLL